MKVYSVLLIIVFSWMKNIFPQLEFTPHMVTKNLVTVRVRKASAFLLVVLCALFGSLGQLRAQSTLYGADGAGGNLSNLYILDPTNGGVTSTINNYL